MNIKQLQEYNKSRRQYHKLLAEEIGRQAVQHILHKARKIQGLYRLEANATEEIEQELSIVAIKASDKWSLEMNAKRSTFVLAAVNNHSAYLARKLSGLPIMENYETGTDMQAVGQFHKISQENIQKFHDKNNAMYPVPVFADKKHCNRQQQIQRKERPKVKPTVVSCGSELADQVACKPTCDNALKLDIESVIDTLTPRQQLIISMLEMGYTQNEIAIKLKTPRQTITDQIHEIRNIFIKFMNSTGSLLSECN